MPPKQAPLKPALQTTISAFLRRLDKPISELQRFLTDYPDYEAQFTEHERAQARHSELMQELEQKDARVLQLEAAMAAFEGVHMNSAKSLKSENTKLAQQLADAKEAVVGAEGAVKLAQRAYVEQVDKTARERKGELERAARDQAVALEKQKGRFEKQHLEALERSNGQLARVTADMKKQAVEMEKVELINEGLKDRASKLKELQQEFSNMPDDELSVRTSSPSV